MGEKVTAPAAIHTWLFTAFSVALKNTLMRRSCSIQLMNSSRVSAVDHSRNGLTV